MEESVEQKEDLSAGPADADKPVSVKSGISIDKITVSKGLDSNSVLQLIKRQLESINKCYKSSRKKFFHWKSGLFITMIVDSTGQVKTVNVNKRNHRNKALEKCIMRNLKHLVFQKPDDGKNVEINISFSVK